MRLVTSMMTTMEMPDGDIAIAAKILQCKFNGEKVEIRKYKYNDRQYYEVDIDLFDVIFPKEEIFAEIDKLISAYEEIMSLVSQEVDFIAANDDTDTEIAMYEKDKNDIKEFGIFVTNRMIPNLEPYYSSAICSAHVNLTHVSFGVY